MYFLSYTTLAWVRVWGGCPVDGRESASVIPFFDLQVRGTGNFETEAPVFGLCPPTTIPPTFHLYSDDEVTTGDPLRAFRQNVLRQIKDTTELHCDCTIDILHVLGRETPPPDQADATSFSLPSLKKIHLYDFMFIHRRDMMFSKLKEQLLARKAAGAGADTWVVGPKLLDADDINEFKGIIHIVDSPQAASSRRRYH